MNTMEKYEAFRNMSPELFESFKYIYNIGHTGVFENIAIVVKYMIAGLLGYMAYDQYDVNSILSILSGISAFSIVFRKRLIGFIPSIIGAFKMSKKVFSSKDGADEILNNLEKAKNALEKHIVSECYDINEK